MSMALSQGAQVEHDLISNPLLLFQKGRSKIEHLSLKERS